MPSCRSFTLIALLPALMVVAGCDRQSAPPAQPQGTSAPKITAALDRSHKGSALPDYTLHDAAGRELRLAALKGKPLLINLWATWCAPCVAELPTLNALAGQNAGLKVLTVSQDSGTPEKIAPFLKAKGGDRLEAWIDPQNDLVFHYGGATLPMTVLYDAAGQEVWRYTGGLDWTGVEATALLGEAAGA